MQIESPKADLKVHIETWGCQMNVADSEQMLSLMKFRNYQWVDSADDADLVILNTCHIREKSKHKVMSRLGVLKQLKTLNPKLTIAVAGCVAQAEGKKLFDQSSAIDILLGPGKIKELPRLVEEFQVNRERQMATGFTKKPNEQDETVVEEDEFPITPEVLSGKNEVSRFINIQQGCNNYCTFCVVPFTRGREISEKPEHILLQIEALIKNGAKEITLLGQNVNSYGLDLTTEISPADGPFVDLLRKVVKVEGVKRLRFTTSNPHDFSPALAKLFGEEAKLGKYIHLPVQSGSDRILASMKRKVTREEYCERLRWLRQAIPDIAISTDIIVGFPGETEEDFAETYSLVKEAAYSFIYSFKYSPRKNTAANRFLEQVPDLVKTRRLAELNALQDEFTMAQNLAEIGRERLVLFHYKSNKETDVYYGRDEHFRAVRVVSGRNIAGMELPVRVTEATKLTLTGLLI